jgi:hypothetical protein
MTDFPSTQSDAFDRFCRRVFGLLGQVALVLLVWLSLIKFPSSPASDLDPSWRMVLGYAELHHFQFGTDLIFTYGPLGYLLPPTSIGVHYWHHLVWQYGANGVFALAIYCLGRSFSGWRLGLYYAYFLAFGVVYIDAVHMIAILLLSLALLRDRLVARPWLAGLLSLGLAVLALVKFTNLLLACFAVLCAVGLYGYRRRWLTAGLIGGVFAAGFLGGWAACGQHLGNLPAYLLNSLNVSNGYAEGMGLYGPGEILFLGLGAVLCLGAYYALTLYLAVDFPRSLAAALIAAAASYLNWKHGFVRADGHVLAHFFLCLFFVVSAPVLLQDEGPLRRLKGGALTLAGLLSFTGVYLSSPITVTDAGIYFNYHLKENVGKVLQTPALPQLAREEFSTISEMHSMPTTRTVVGKGTIDVLGNEQAYALFNQLNYRPRPVFQSYFPYTEHLQRVNEAFMRSDRAPDYILQKVQSIDYRLPSLEDSLVTRYLYHHYTFMMEDHDFLLWRRNPPDPTLDEKTPLSSSTLQFGERFTVPAVGETPVWCELDIQPSLLGRVRGFFYKPPLLKIAISDGSAFTTGYRLVRGMARAGFLLYPHFTSNLNIRQFESEHGGPAPRINWFTIELDPALRRYFKPGIGVRLYTLPPFPRALAKESVRPEIRYRVFSQVPTVVNAPYPTDILLENNKEVLLAHPPSSIEFDVAAQNRHVTGKFGLIANAYTKGNTTDGAEFIIEWVNSQGEVSRLFQRLLQPLTVTGDRGEQSFDFYSPPGGGRLILRTNGGPNGNLSFDWTYWTDVKFAP